VAFSLDGRRVVAGGGPNHCCLMWDVGKPKKPIQEFTGHTGRVLTVVFTADGRRMLSAGMDKTVRLWDVERGSEIRRFEGHAGFIGTVQVSPDGRRLLTGSYDSSIRLWELETGRLLDSFDVHETPVLSVTFTADGKHVLSGGADEAVRLWKVDLNQKPSSPNPKDS
jgi:WD40 repeat protein